VLGTLDARSFRIRKGGRGCGRYCPIITAAPVPVLVARGRYRTWQLCRLDRRCRGYEVGVCGAELLSSRMGSRDWRNVWGSGISVASGVAAGDPGGLPPVGKGQRGFDRPLRGLTGGAGCRGLIRSGGLSPAQQPSRACFFSRLRSGRSFVSAQRVLSWLVGA